VIEITGAEHRVTGIPRLAVQGNDVVLAWTESGAAADGREQVKVAVVRP
jgi:hypothetical protein